MKRKPKETPEAPTETQGPTTPRGAQRQSRLLNVAAELFDERGFSGVSIQDIVQRAGGSMTTVYKWFGGKEALFTAVFSDRMREASRVFSEIPIRGNDLDADILRLLKKIFAWRTYQLFRFLLQEGGMMADFQGKLLTQMEQNIYHPLTGWLERIQQTYGIRFALPTEEVMLVMVRMVRGCIVELTLCSRNVTTRQNEMITQILFLLKRLQEPKPLRRVSQRKREVK